MCDKALNGRRAFLYKLQFYRIACILSERLYPSMGLIHPLPSTMNVMNFQLSPTELSSSISGKDKVLPQGAYNLNFNSMEEQRGLEGKGKM